MIINVEKNFIFIHIPKNAGTEMTRNIGKVYKKNIILQQVDPKTGIDKMHLYLDVIHKYVNPNLFENAIKFCIIRNPYEKLYSAWNYLRNRYQFSNVNDFIKYKINKEFIYGLELIPRDARVHYRPQHTFIYDIEGNKKVDYIIRYENLNNDIKSLNKKYNYIIPEYGDIAKYAINKYFRYFNSESVQKINELYELDFKLFGYEMILP